jgi:hypothetical protein
MSYVVALATALFMCLSCALASAASARDRDRDGLSDRYEQKQSNTSPKRADTDDDGLRDGAEVKRYKTNPRKKDTDGDGIGDGAEVFPETFVGGRVRGFVYGNDAPAPTSPRKADTDGDGLTDRVERHLGTNPTLRDSDGDDLSDSREVWRYGTNPRSADTDGDGYTDGVEVFMGSNPRDGNSPGTAPTPPPTTPTTPKPPTTTPTTPTTPEPPPPTTPTTPTTPEPPPPPPPPADTTPPQTTINTGPDSSTTSTTATFTFSANETGSAFACRLDGGSWTPCSSPDSLTSVGVGSHTFDVRATDGSGNTDATAASRTWTVTAPPPPPPPPPPTGDCDKTLSSAGDVQGAVSTAAAGDVICLANGTYGRLTLSASKSAPGVTVRAANPGQATIAGATLSGSNITIARFRMTGTFEPRPGSQGMTADHNHFIGGGYYAVMACASTSTTCDDISITGNIFDGRFDEDMIRANRYHDSGDADAYGLLVEGNEFRGNQEYGGHNDVFQSVWVGDHLVFRKNFLHDFGGQGFFVKDQASAIDGLIADDNLIVRQDLPCDPVSLCPTWQLSPFQVFGPLKNVSIRHNTVWPGSGGGTQWLRGSGWAGPTEFSDNVFSNLNSDASGLTTGYTASNNTRCGGSGFPATGVSSDCTPPFANPAVDDYRLPNGRGVTWAVADQHFGP